MKLRILVTVAIAAQIFSPIARAGNEGKTGEGVCAQYSAFVSDLANRLYNLKPEVVSAANKIIDPAKVQYFAVRLKCVPVDSLASGRAAETMETATGFQTKLDWKRTLLYSRRQFVGLASHEIAVALKWENSDHYTEVSKKMGGLFFKHYIEHSDFPSKCSGESGFDSSGEIFTCIHPRVLQNRFEWPVSRNDANTTDGSEYQNVCVRMGFTKMVDHIQKRFDDKLFSAHLTKHGLISHTTDQWYRLMMISCQ
jgi:hypothetical protein